MLNENEIARKVEERIRESYQRGIWDKARGIIRYLRWHGHPDNPELRLDNWGSGYSFADPETSLRINADLGWQIMSGFDFSPLIDILWENETVYSASKLERIGLGISLIPVPYQKPKVKVYEPGDWEERLDYLADPEKLRIVITNHEKRLRERLLEQKLRRFGLT